MSIQNSITLNDIPNVDMDDSGVFKYIQIKLKHTQSEQEKIIIRGYEECEYHADIFDRVAPFLQNAGIQCFCLGGGRIRRTDEEIFVYGYSVGFGKADHDVTCGVIKEDLGPGPYVHWSDEGY